ncbi:TPA: AlpA family phage regulatory protein [Aeromonas veronii]|nr:AlpA family phage regulatory protein [Aeromonas veronii]
MAYLVTSNLITMKELCELMRISRPTVYRRTKDPESGFPRPLHIGVNAVRFRLSDVESYIESLSKAEVAA